MVRVIADKSRLHGLTVEVEIAETTVSHYLTVRAPDRLGRIVIRVSDHPERQREGRTQADWLVSPRDDPAKIVARLAHHFGRVVAEEAH
jgi:hypothetical protein